MLYLKHNPGLEGLRKILRVDLDGKIRGMRSQGYDRCIAICGEEGSGKSTLALHLLELWYNDILQKPEELTINKMPSNRKELASTLNEIQEKDFKYAMFFHDEAVKDLYRKDGITKFQKIMEVSYTVIRGLNLYSGWLIPSILDLSKMFRTRRIRGMFYVYGRGKYAYYSKKQLKKLIPAMQQNQNFGGDPNPFDVRDTVGRVIKPFCIGTFGNYHGSLKEEYAVRKAANMKQSLQDLADLADGKEKNEEPPQVKEKNKMMEKAEKVYLFMKERGINVVNKKAYKSALNTCVLKYNIANSTLAKDLHQGYLETIGEKYETA